MPSFKGLCRLAWLDRHMVMDSDRQSLCPTAVPISGIAMHGGVGPPSRRLLKTFDSRLLFGDGAPARPPACLCIAIIQLLDFAPAAFC
eukprot:SAG31_NODE_958_length_10763_cov_8.374531_3_plen_88_part_00